MSDDEDFTPPWAFGGFIGHVETYGTSILERALADHVFPDGWQSGDGHGRKVMHVVSRYLDTPEIPDDRERLRQARLTIAKELDVCERTIRRATGERLYGDDIPNYEFQFRRDLREIERLWRAHADDAPDRVCP